MSISPSTMKCPSCADAMLEIISAPLGTWERCPNCSGLFIRHDIIASASQDRAKCVDAIEETKILLLPTERWCPKCLQKLYDGRVRSRGVIFSLCSTCESFWTSLPVLRQFEELVEKTLRMQMELADAAPSSLSGAAGTTTPPVNLAKDSAMGRLFRSSARLFDRMADSLRKEGGESSVKEEKPKRSAKEATPTKPASAKPEAQKESVKPEKPAEPVKPMEPEPLPLAPEIEIPEFIFPEEPVLKEKAEAPLPPPPAPPPPAPPPVEAIAAAKPISQAIPVPQPKPKPSFGQKLVALFKPRPRARFVPKPVPAKPVKAVEPVKVVKPVSPVKPVKEPKPKKEKPPREPFDAFAFTPPWAMGALSVALSGFREYGFEGGPAMLWGLMGWSVGMMVRLKRMYPSKPFQESTLQALAELKGPLGWRGIPVTLKGQIVSAREEDPKGIVVFRQEERTIALNRLGRWDFIPRLFGLSNPRQLLKGEVALKGWYRGGLTPSLEVHEVKAEKSSRKSMVRSLRWVCAALVFVVALVIYLSLD